MSLDLLKQKYSSALVTGDVPVERTQSVIAKRFLDLGTKNAEPRPQLPCLSVCQCQSDAHVNFSNKADMRLARFDNGICVRLVSFSGYALSSGIRLDLAAAVVVYSSCPHFFGHVSWKQLRQFCIRRDKMASAIAILAKAYPLFSPTHCAPDAPLSDFPYIIKCIYISYIIHYNQSRSLW